MDPVTAAGLASSIITFIDFSWSLVSGAVEIYHSIDGTLEENAYLEDVMGDLRSIAEDLSQGGPRKTKSERNLQLIAEDCHKDSKSLLNILEELRVPGKRTPWKSLKTAWASLRKKDRVSGLGKKLQGYRSEMLLYLGMILR
jgi:hypothetical protein